MRNLLLMLGLSVLFCSTVVLAEENQVNTVVFETTQGYPRRVTVLCQRMVEELLIRNKRLVDQSLAVEVAELEQVTTEVRP
jgi:N-acyl-L-homoserine lactone synthetase